MDDFEGEVKIVSSMTLKNRKNDGINTLHQFGTTLKRSKKYGKGTRLQSRSSSLFLIPCHVVSTYLYASDIARLLLKYYWKDLNTTYSFQIKSKFAYSMLCE